MTRPNRLEYIVNEKPGDCTTCPRRPTCTCLCAEVERWVSQDFVGRNSNLVLENGGHHGKGMAEIGAEFLDIIGLGNDDMTVEDLDGELSRRSWLRVKAMRLSEKITRFIYSYYVAGKRIRDIAIDEKATSQAIDRRHNQAKISIASRLKMEQKWESKRNSIDFGSIRAFDMAVLFWKYHYPRKIIAKILQVHSSTVLKYIKKVY